MDVWNKSCISWTPLAALCSVGGANVYCLFSRSPSTEKGCLIQIHNSLHPAIMSVLRGGSFEGGVYLGQHYRGASLSVPTGSEHFPPRLGLLPRLPASRYPLCRGGSLEDLVFLDHRCREMSLILSYCLEQTAPPHKAREICAGGWTKHSRPANK
jgi:hypothetical protein